MSTTTPSRIPTKTPSEKRLSKSPYTSSSSVATAGGGAGAPAGPGQSPAKVGSLGQASPGKKVFSEGKKDYSKVTSKIGSLENLSHKPAGGDVKILNAKVDYKNKASSKVGSLDNLSHKPAGGDVKIKSEKLDFSKASSKVGSKDNLAHVPAGGNVKIRSEKLNFKEKAEAKINATTPSRSLSRGGSEATMSPVQGGSPVPPQ